MSEPLISVIVPVYKVESFLCKCVESIRNQTYTNLEIILVDDGSPDLCGEICDDYALKDQRIRVIHKENGGLSSARNAGIDVATGEFLAFVDSDDWIELDCYEKLLHLAEKYNVPLVCAGRYDVDGATGEEAVGMCPEKEELISAEELVNRIFRWQQIDSAAWDKLYAAWLFEGIRYPVGVVGEDIPVTYRLALRAERCALGDFPVYHYYHRPGSITTEPISERIFNIPDNTISVYSVISQEYPALLDAARFLMVRTSGWMAQLLDIAPECVRRRYQDRHRKYVKILRSNARFIAACPYFTATQKRDYLLVTFRVYRPMRMLFHFLKRV